RSAAPGSGRSRCRRTNCARKSGARCTAGWRWPAWNKQPDRTVARAPRKPAHETNCRAARRPACEHRVRAGRGAGPHRHACVDLRPRPRQARRTRSTMSRNQRNFTLQSDLGDALRFAGMDGSERLGGLFEFRVRAVSQDPKLDLVAMLGKPMAVHMRMPDGFERWFHGIAIEAAQTGFQVVDDLRHAVYAITLAPTPWLLTQRRHSRVFANRDVASIVREVLAGVGYTDVRLQLSASYPVRETCVQYREDDFSFISRLMEQEGVYYYFVHQDHRHLMVLADGIGAHEAAPGAAQLPWLSAGDHRARATVGVGDWRPSSAVHTTSARLTDYDPLNPRASLEGKGEAGQGASLHGVDGLEAFDFPGGETSADE